MTNPFWHRTNLTEHYRRHPAGNDKDCWCDLLGKRPGPVSQNEYESESHRVVERPWLVFRALYRDNELSGGETVQYFVDERQCLTAVHFKSKAIKTCFHDHVGRKHAVLPLFKGKVEFLKKWTAKRYCSDPRIAGIPQIDRFNVGDQDRKELATYRAEFTAITRRGNRR